MKFGGRIALTVGLSGLGAGYTAGMMFISALFVGIGHGTPIYGNIVAGPGGILLPLWAILGGFLAWLPSRRAIIFVIILSLLPLVWSYFANQTGYDPYRTKVDRSMPDLVKVFWILYFSPTVIGLAACTAAMIERNGRKEQNA